MTTSRPVDRAPRASAPPVSLLAIRAIARDWRDTFVPASALQPWLQAARRSNGTADPTANCGMPVRLLPRAMRPRREHLPQFAACLGVRYPDPTTFSRVRHLLRGIKPRPPYRAPQILRHIAACLSVSFTLYLRASHKRRPAVVPRAPQDDPRLLQAASSPCHPAPLSGFLAPFTAHSRTTIPPPPSRSCGKLRYAWQIASVRYSPLPAGEGLGVRSAGGEVRRARREVSRQPATR
jgi:hypothetical protein